MNVFVAVARLNSFTEGANTVGISTKLASKYVAQLEQKLGAQLLHRTTRSVTLTATGAAYLERCIPILDQIGELESVVDSNQKEISGPIRLCAPTALGSNELIRALNEFQRRNPKISFDVQLDDKRVAIIEDGFDLAIRFGKLEDSSLIARRLTNMRVVVVASPGYLTKFGKPATPDDLKNHNCLLFTSSVDPYHWRFSNEQQDFVINAEGSFRTNSPVAIRNLVLNDTGIGRIPYYLVQENIQKGEMVALFEELETNDFALNAVYPPSRHLTTRIRALIDFLVEYFKQFNYDK